MTFSRTLKYISYSLIILIIEIIIYFFPQKMGFDQDLWLIILITFNLSWGIFTGFSKKVIQKISWMILLNMMFLSALLVFFLALMYDHQKVYWNVVGVLALSLLSLFPPVTWLLAPFITGYMVVKIAQFMINFWKNKEIKIQKNLLN